jgi:AraC-like DNA-binding protein
LVISSAAPLQEAVFRAMSETAALSARFMLGAVLEDASRGIVYHFPRKAPKHADRLRAALGGTVAFDQRQYAIVLANALCARPSPYADEALLATALAELETAAGRIKVEDTLTLRVERLLKRRRTGRLSEDDAARELGLSRRTLVRRLAATGTSYRALLDANLKQHARQLLDADKHSRSDMAEMLGFEDPTSFSRACRRWFKALSPN